MALFLDLVLRDDADGGRRLSCFLLVFGRADHRFHLYSSKILQTHGFQRRQTIRIVSGPCEDGAGSHHCRGNSAFKWRICVHGLLALNEAGTPQGPNGHQGLNYCVELQ